MSFYGNNSLIARSKVLWTPSTLGSNLALWLDADDSSTLTLNGSTVSQWRDKSGNARNLSQATADNQPTRTLNGMNGRTALTFSGNQWLFNPTNAAILRNAAGGSLTAVNNYSNFTVQRFSVFLANGMQPLPTSRMGMVVNGSGFLVGGGRRLDSDDFAGGFSPTAYTAATNVIQSIVHNYTGNQVSQFVNGSVAGTASFSSGGGNSSDTDATNIMVGGTSQNDGVTLDLDQPMVGLISEVVLTQGIISTLDRQRLEGYLAHKWGLTANLPVDHPFKSSPPRY
jgi:hypothetical protein